MWIIQVKLNGKIESEFSITKHWNEPFPMVGDRIQLSRCVGEVVQRYLAYGSKRMTIYCEER